MQNFSKTLSTHIKRMNGRSPVIFLCFRRKALLLLNSFLFLSLISCGGAIAPRHTPVVLKPVPLESISKADEPSDGDLQKTAKVVLDIPPPVPVLPPIPFPFEEVEEFKAPPPPSWKIVVKKNERKLFLYQKGDLRQIYPIDLGENPEGPKIHQGDMKTPEGDYRIIGKKDRGKTKYYLAFLLNYPNETDRLRFERAVKEGRVSKEKGIGGLIEIHGFGKGMDWTQGCIALYNGHMEELFNQIPVGTPVKIEP